MALRIRRALDFAVNDSVVLRSKIRASLQECARELSTQEYEFEVSRSDAEDFANRGEFSSNIARVLAAKIKSDPENIAQTLQTFWPHSELKIKTQNGFLNFRMSDEILFQSIERALQQGRNYGASAVLGQLRINVEFVSADPTGPLSLQHGRIAATGDALCNLLAAQGANVTREYFLNDIETSSKLKLLGESVAALYEETFGGSSAPEGALRDNFTKNIARDLAAARGNELLLLPDAERVAESTHAARETAVSGQKNTLKKFGTHFDVWTSESALRSDRLLESVLEKLRASGNAYEKDGALWLGSTAFGDEADRPLRRASGEYSYLAADIAYHAYRFARNFDLLVNIWTGQHRQYVARTHAALRAAGFPDEKLEVLVCESAQLLRDGELMAGEDGEPSLDDALEEIEAQNLRLLFLLQDADEAIKIEIETAARDDETNPAYAARLLPARLSTLLREAEASNSKTEKSNTPGNFQSETEKQLARFVALWPDELETAARERKPQRVARFVLEMSEATRQFLVAARPGEALSPSVLRAALIVSQNALRVLNIEPRENF